MKKKIERNTKNKQIKEEEEREKEALVAKVSFTKGEEKLILANITYCLPFTRTILIQSVCLCIVYRLNNTREKRQPKDST